MKLVSIFFKASESIFEGISKIRILPQVDKTISKRVKKHDKLQFVQ